MCGKKMCVSPHPTQIISVTRGLYILGSNLLHVSPHFCHSGLQLAHGDTLCTLSSCWPLTRLDPGNMLLATGLGWREVGLIDNVALKRWSRFGPPTLRRMWAVSCDRSRVALSPTGWKGGSAYARGHKGGFKHTTLTSGIMSGPPALCSE